MAHREPQPDPRLPPRRRPQAPTANENPAPASAPRVRQPAPEPGDFLGLGMELSAKTRRDAAHEARMNELHPPPPPPVALPPLPNVTRAPAPGSYFDAQAAGTYPTTQPSAPTGFYPSSAHPSGVGQSSANPNRANTQLPRTNATNPQAGNVRSNIAPSNTQGAGAFSPGTQSSPRPTARVPAAPPAPTTLAGMMQPLPFEAQPPRQTEDPVRTNSWLLALDDARAGRAGAEPVVADPSNVLRSPRVARPLDTSFSEPEPVTRRSAPWLVGGLVAVAACSLVFVFSNTLTHIDPDATHTKVVPPLVPDSRSVAHEVLSDPLDPGSASSKHKRTTSARPVPHASPTATVLPPTNVSAPSTAVSDAGNSVQAPSAMPRTRPQPPQESPSAPPQQDILILPDPASSNAPTDPPDLAPAPTSGGGEQASKQSSSSEPPARMEWWSGSLRTTPLAMNESGPTAEEYAASTERQARVSQWLMRESRGASPLADTASVFPFVNSSVSGAPQPSRPSSAHESDDSAPRSPVVAAASSRAAKSTSEAETTPVSILWEGTTVPADRITANVRLLTPQVGRVRADLRNGHAIEGKLYAVGTGRVWIDADVGRIALLRGEIARLEQVATVIDDTDEDVVDDIAKPALETTAAEVAVAAPATSKPAPAPVPEPPPRVRVRTPGGVFFGQIVTREGSSLTLLTDEGSRITLESNDIEAAPISKPVVKHVQAPATKKQAATGTTPDPH